MSLGLSVLGHGPGIFHVRPRQNVVLSRNKTKHIRFGSTDSSPVGKALSGFSHSSRTLYDDFSHVSHIQDFSSFKRFVDQLQDSFKNIHRYGPSDREMLTRQFGQLYDDMQSWQEHLKREPVEVQLRPAWLATKNILTAEEGLELMLFERWRSLQDQHHPSASGTPPAPLVKAGLKYFNATGAAGKEAFRQVLDGRNVTREIRRSINVDLLNQVSRNKLTDEEAMLIGRFLNPSVEEAGRQFGTAPVWQRESPLGAREVLSFLACATPYPLLAETLHTLAVRPEPVASPQSLRILTGTLQEIADRAAQLPWRNAHSRQRALEFRPEDKSLISQHVTYEQHWSKLHEPVRTVLYRIRNAVRKQTGLKNEQTKPFAHDREILEALIDFSFWPFPELAKGIQKLSWGQKSNFPEGGTPTPYERQSVEALFRVQEHLGTALSNGIESPQYSKPGITGAIRYHMGRLNAKAKGNKPLTKQENNLLEACKTFTRLYAQESEDPEGLPGTNEERNRDDRNDDRYRD